MFRGVFAGTADFCALCLQIVLEPKPCPKSALDPKNNRKLHDKNIYIYFFFKKK